MVEPVFAQIKLRQRAGRFHGGAIRLARRGLTAATHSVEKLYVAGFRPQVA